MAERFDVAVIGAGPGGLSAAETAATMGLRVCLVDDNPELGGQLWRQRAGQPDNGSPVARWRSAVGPRVTTLAGWRVVAAPSIEPGALRLEAEGRLMDIQASKLILATGARELYLPFPGWTLPGVYGAGGLQAFVKSGLQVAGKRVVLAGTGPLLLAVASGLTKAGARVLAIAEQAPLAKLAGFTIGLLGTAPGKVLEGIRYGWTNRRIPYRTGSWVSAALGKDRLHAVQITSGSRTQAIETDMLGVGFHLVANTELAELLGCTVADGFVLVDERQRTSLPDVYCVGEATGIGGVSKAELEGKIAVMAAAGKTEGLHALASARDRQLKFMRSLTAAFALRSELRKVPRAATIVCRCEDVEHGSLSERQSWREAKLHTRCGMGPCQGRICGPATQFLYGWSSPQPRPPLFPTAIETLSHAAYLSETVEALKASPKH